MDRLRIWVDGSGGDNSWVNIIEWAVNFAKTKKDIDIVLHVTHAQVSEVMNRSDFPDNIAVAWSDAVVPHEFKLSWTWRDLLRDYKTSTMLENFHLLKDGSIDGVLSAWNTAAFILASNFLIKKISRDVKLVLASEFPSPTKRVWLGLDMWANPDISPEHIINYILLAQAYTELRYGESLPVWTLNIGTEDGKGMEQHVQTNKLLRILWEQWLVDYIWNVEPNALVTWDKKIVAWGAFDMNIALKGIKDGSDLTLNDMWEKLLGSKYWPKLAQWLKRKVNKSAWALLLWANAPLAKANGNSTPEMIERTLEELYRYILLERDDQIIKKMSLLHARKFEQFRSLDLEVE